jgi:hypothetical protein
LTNARCTMSSTNTRDEKEGGGRGGQRSGETAPKKAKSTPAPTAEKAAQRTPATATGRGFPHPTR